MLKALLKDLIALTPFKPCKGSGIHGAYSPRLSFLLSLLRVYVGDSIPTLRPENSSLAKIEITLWRTKLRQESSEAANLAEHHQSESQRRGPHSYIHRVNSIVILEFVYTVKKNGSKEVDD